MEFVLRLLMPGKKGIGKRISQAISEAGGRVESTWVVREMRGMNETELRVSCVSESLRGAIVQSLGQVSGVALIGTPSTIAP